MILLHFMEIIFFNFMKIQQKAGSFKYFLEYSLDMRAKTR